MAIKPRTEQPPPVVTNIARQFATIAPGPRSTKDKPGSKVRKGKPKDPFKYGTKG